MRRITQLAAKLNYNQIIIDASNRFHAIVNACMNSKDYTTIAGLTCSSMYNSEKDIPAVKEEEEKEEKEQPVLDQDFCFNYRGYQFELSACNNITCRDQIIGLTYDNIKQQFPNGIFTDRYVCWMHGHKDCEGHTKEELENPEFFAPNIYLVPGAWSWGAECDLQPGVEVSTLVLKGIDKFLESFKE